MTSPALTAPARDRRWLLMAFAAVAQLMLVLDTTIVNIALPSAQRSLGFTDAARQWVVTAYALAFGSLLLLGGRLADRFGRKQTFITGLIGFAAASALGGAASEFWLLVSARALQGMFGALLAPSVLSTLAVTFTDPKERAKAFGIFGTVAVSGGAVCLTLGGLLTEYANWRWCMYVNVAFALVTIAGIATLMPDIESPHRPRFDFVGVTLGSLGLLAIVFGFSRAETSGWASPGCYGILAAGAVLLIAFVYSQTKVASPLLPLRIPAHRARGGAYLSTSTAMIGMFGLFLFLTHYMQQVKHFSPVQSGLAFLPMVACMIIMSNVSSLYLLNRLGPRVLIPSGMLFGCLGMIGLSTIDPGTGYAALVLPSVLAIGIGMGCVIPPSINTATSGVTPADAGIAGALVNTGQQVGGSIGTAVLSTLVASASAGFSGPPAAAATHGYATAFAVSAGIFGAGAVLGALILPSRNRKTDAPIATHSAMQSEVTEILME